MRAEGPAQGMPRADPLRESAACGVCAMSGASSLVVHAISVEVSGGVRDDIGYAPNERARPSAFVAARLRRRAVRGRRGVRRGQRREQLTAHGVRVENPRGDQLRARSARLVDARGRGAHQASAQRIFRALASPRAYHGDDAACRDALDRWLGRGLDVREERVRLRVPAASRAHVHAAPPAPSPSALAR